MSDETKKESERFVIWGRNPVIEAISSGQPLEKVLIAHDSHPPKKLLELVNENGIKLQKVPRRKVESLAGTKKTQGVAALVSPVPYVPLNELLDRVIAEKGALLALDHLTDPQNVGNIIRSAEVLGFSGLITPRERSCPLNDVVVKSSAGAIFHLPICRVSGLRQALVTFKKRGGWILVLEKGGAPLPELDPPFPLVLVIGSEGRGTAKSIVEMADIVTSIPMRGKVTSLNAASATAIALHHIASARPTS